MLLPTAWLLPLPWTPRRRGLPEWRCCTREVLVFRGIVDQQDTKISPQGNRLRLVARSLAALLLDNEALPQTYINPSLRGLFERHARAVWVPFVCRQRRGLPRQTDGGKRDERMAGLCRGSATTFWALRSPCVPTACWTLPGIPPKGLLRFPIRTVSRIKASRIRIFSAGVSRKIWLQAGVGTGYQGHVVMRKLPVWESNENGIKPQPNYQGTSVLRKSRRQAEECTLSCPGWVPAQLGMEASLADPFFGESDGLDGSQMYLSAVPGGGIDLLRPAQETAAVKEEEKEVWITNQTARRSPGGPAFQIGWSSATRARELPCGQKASIGGMRPGRAVGGVFPAAGRRAGSDIPRRESGRAGALCGGPYPPGKAWNQGNFVFVPPAAPKSICETMARSSSTGRFPERRGMMDTALADGDLYAIRWGCPWYWKERKNFCSKSGSGFRPGAAVSHTILPWAAACSGSKSRGDPAQRQREALEYVQEALSPMHQIDLQHVALTETGVQVWRVDRFW